ncbi:hypothetical protein G9A89_021823 [Geosiphon pyriformis]|nr:hypothetical protein G9A89_021823 [Geosiphon pyriformis]
MYGHFKTTNTTAPLIDFEEDKPKPTWETYQVSWADEKHNKLLPILSWDNNGKGKQKEEPTWKTDNLTWTNHDKSEPTTSWVWEEKNTKRKRKEKKEEVTTTTHNLYAYTIPYWFTYHYLKLICTNCGKKLSSMSACCDNNKEYQTATKFYCRTCLIKCFGRPKRVEKWDNTLYLACGETLLDEGMWNDIPGRGKMCDELCQYTILISNWVRKGTSIKATWRRAIDFEYYNECDLIYNPPPRIIYIISEEEEPISNCALESESSFNSDSNSNNDNNENIGSSFIQYGENNDNDSNSDLNPNSNYEQYIALPDLTKKQELKWFSDNNEDIMPERVNNTDAGFDLRYSGKDAIKLEPHSCTCIDLKIALEILTTTIVQLTSRNSLMKREINIRGRIIDMRYIENIITMLQNDSEKTYIIEPNKKIAQAIFLPLVKVAQLVPMRNKEELGITAKGIQGFGFTGRIDVPVNMVEEEIIGQGKIISTSQTISIPPYN